MSNVGTNVRHGQPLAVVVGAGGMAMAIARRLGDQYRILIADRDGDHLDRQVHALRAEGHVADGVTCDVADEHAVGELAAAAQLTGPLRALAHVVGLSPAMADGITIMKVNLLGATLVANAFLDLVGPGTAAVFIASLAGHRDAISPGLAEVLDDPLMPDWIARVQSAAGEEITPGLAYRMSKRGLMRMCRHKAGEWGERGARIVSLSPGLINTPQGAQSYIHHPAKYAQVEATPLKREGTMIEIADAVEFLVSDRASFISGTDLLVDGGVAAATLDGGYL